MQAFKRMLLAVTSGLTITAVLALAASSSLAGSATFRFLRSDVTQAMAGVRPAAAAPAGGTATSFLPPMVLTVGPDVTLQSKLVMTGTVTITCGPFLSTSFSSASVDVTEAAGRAVARAFGTVPALICDGSPHSFAFTAAASNITFRPDTGQAQVFASACGTAPDFSFQCESGQTMATVNIRK